MIRLTKERVNDVLAYMEDDLPNCLYLYGDIERYGVDDPNMTVWYSEKDGKFNAVVMKYFSGSQVYSKDLDYDLDELVEQLRSFSPDRISSQRAVIEELKNVLGAEYDADYGVVFKLNNYRKFRSVVQIERAKPEDADDIADLLMTNDLYSKTYEKQKLSAELADRIKTGIGRSYIIRDGGRIVAHDGVLLETNTYMVEGLALVRDDYRMKLYGALLESYMINSVREEGKELYCMIGAENRMNAFEKMGNEIKAHYGKLFRKALQEG